MRGTGFLAIWSDVEAHDLTDYRHWLTREHTTERVTTKGFLGVRVFRAQRGDPARFFILYELESPEVLDGPAYLARLNAPTPWTVATVPHFRNVARSLCEVAASFGAGQGGLVATFRYAVPEAQAERHRQRVVQEFLPRLAATAGVAGCHLLVADAAASAVETAEKRVRAEKNAVPRWIILVEGWGDGDAFRAACARLVTEEAFSAAEAPPAFGVYRLQNSRGAPA